MICVKRPRFKIETWQMLFVVVASAFAVVFLNSLAYGLSPQTVLDSLIHTFFIASTVSIGILYAAPRIYRLSPAKRVLLIAPLIFVTTVVGILLTRFFLRLFDNYGIDGYYTPSLRTLVFSLVISYIFGFGAYFYLHSQNRLRRTKELLRQKELDEVRAKSLAAQARLASLESKIHPHFLFNTLNSIASLIRDDPEKAEKMTEKLSALLRYSLDFEPNRLVTLAEELKITRAYLEIEAARFAEKLDFVFDVDPRLENERVPAFALQTLVENAVKHVAAKSSAKTRISIRAYNSANSIKLEVADSGPGFSAADIKPGHGLDILQMRLQNIFGDGADLEIPAAETGGRVRLRIDQNLL